MWLVEPIIRAVEFIEKNLKEDITVQDAADAAFYSLYHFSRNFNATTGHSPYDYIMRRRLSEAAKELAKSERRIIEIALDYRFNSSEAFTRAFRKMFGCLPKQIKQRRSTGGLILKSLLSRESVSNCVEWKPGPPRLIEKGKIHLVGFSSQCSSRTGLLQKLEGRIEMIQNTVTPRKILLLSEYPPRDGCFMTAGVEVSSLESAPFPFVGTILSAGKYADFGECSKAKDIDLALDYIFQTWLPKAGIHPTFQGAVIDYPSVRPQTDEQAVRISIPVLP